MPDSVDPKTQASSAPRAEGLDDATTPLADLKRRVADFSRARDWEQFHHPKELAVALAIEVGEILELFRFHSLEHIDQVLDTPQGQTALAHELADCLWLILRMADVRDIDLTQALIEKLALAHQKYPIELSKGQTLKYTHYQQPTADETNTKASDSPSGAPETSPETPTAPRPANTRSKEDRP